MKKIILFFTAILLAAWICGCTAPSDESSVTSSTAESTSSVTDESASVSSEESVLDVTEESSDISEETPIRTALTDDEYQRLDAYLTALEEKDLQDKGWQNGNREEKPIFLGIVGSYTLCEWRYYEWQMHDLELPEGALPYYYVTPSFASQCGVYALDDENILKLEDVLREHMTLDEVYDLLTVTSRQFLDELLNQ